MFPIIYQRGAHPNSWCLRVNNTARARRGFKTQEDAQKAADVWLANRRAKTARKNLKRKMRENFMHWLSVSADRMP